MSYYIFCALFMSDCKTKQLMESQLFIIKRNIEIAQQICILKNNKWTKSLPMHLGLATKLCTCKDGNQITVQLSYQFTLNSFVPYFGT